jgi:hypothetical protein
VPSPGHPGSRQRVVRMPTDVSVEPKITAPFTTAWTVGTMVLTLPVTCEDYTVGDLVMVSTGG